MPRTTNHVVLNLKTLHWDHVLPLPPEPGQPPEFPPPLSLVVWPVFIKIDGNTAQVSAETKLTGSATVTGTTGLGSLGTLLQPNSSISIPPDIGESAAIQIRPIPVDPTVQSLPFDGGVLGPNLPAVFGVVALVLNRGVIEDDALLAGHTALNSAVATALNQLIIERPFDANHRKIVKEDIDFLTNHIKPQVKDAVHNAMGTGDKINAFLRGGGTLGVVIQHFDQDDLPGLRHDLEQKGFSQTIVPARAYYGSIGVDGSISLAPAKDRSISLDRAIIAAALTGGISSMFTTPG